MRTRKNKRKISGGGSDGNIHFELFTIHHFSRQTFYLANHIGLDKLCEAFNNLIPQGNNINDYYIQKDIRYRGWDLFVESTSDTTEYYGPFNSVRCGRRITSPVISFYTDINGREGLNQYNVNPKFKIVEVPKGSRIARYFSPPPPHPPLGRFLNPPFHNPQPAPYVLPLMLPPRIPPQPVNQNQRNPFINPQARLNGQGQRGLFDGQGQRGLFDGARGDRGDRGDRGAQGDQDDEGDQGDRDHQDTVEWPARPRPQDMNGHPRPIQLSFQLGGRVKKTRKNKNNKRK